MIYGDVAVDMDLSRLAQFHRQRRALATIVAHPNDHPHESDLLRTDAQARVLEILPRQSRPEGYYRNLVPAAVYCLSPGIFDCIQPQAKQDFIGDLFPRLLGGPAAVYAYATPEYLRDMGTLGRYETVQAGSRKRPGPKDALQPAASGRLLRSRRRAQRRDRRPRHPAVRGAGAFAAGRGSGEEGQPPGLAGGGGDQSGRRWPRA